MSGRASATPPITGPGDTDDGNDGADGGRSKPKKAPNAFRTISEVADELHIPQHVLRFWETKFPQVKPLKRGGGRRYYRPDDITLLRRVSDLLYIQGYTIKGVQRLLREGGGRLSDDIPPAPPEEQGEDESEASAAHAYAPELPMPGLTRAPVPGAASVARRPAAPLTGRGDVQRSDGARRGGDAQAAENAEAARLRAVLLYTLRELEALRALLP